MAEEKKQVSQKMYAFFLFVFPYFPGTPFPGEWQWSGCQEVLESQMTAF